MCILSSSHQGLWEGMKGGKVGEIAEGQALGSWYEGLLKVFLGLQGEGYSHLGPFYIGRKEDDFFSPWWVYRPQMSELGPDLCGAAGWKVVFSVLSASQHCQEVSSTGKNWVLGLPDC